jgi:hypothetical protein
LILISQHPTIRRSADAARHCRCHDHDLLGILGLSQVVYLGGILARPRSIGDLDDALTELRKREDTLRTAMLYNTDADADGKLPALTGKQTVANPSLSTTNTPIALQRYRAQQRQVALMIESTLEVGVDESKLDPDLNFS